MADELIRTFVAVEVPPGIKGRISEAVEPVKRQIRLRWTAPTGWHLTLKFLGELSREEVERVIGATEVTASRLKPFEVALGGWGAFPSPGRPRVLWVGATTGAEELVNAASALDRNLAEAGFPPEEKAFHPHLTIARVNEAPAASDAFERLRTHALPPETFRVEHLVVFRSILDRGGARYHPLAVCSVGGIPAG